MDTPPRIIDYARPQKPDHRPKERRGRSATVGMIVLAVPCLANLALIIVLFVYPDFGDQADFGFAVLSYFGGLASAVVGIAVFFASGRPPGVARLLLALFIVTPLIDVLLVLIVRAGGFGMG
jgi:hypothetical protein